MFGQPQIGGGQNYLQMLMEMFKRFGQQGQNTTPQVLAPQNNLGMSNMAGQAMGQQMSKPQAATGGTWSDFHNVMQKPGTLARNIPTNSNANQGMASSNIIPQNKPVVNSQSVPVYNDPTKPFPFVNNNAHLASTIPQFEQQKQDWAAGKFRLR